MKTQNICNESDSVVRDRISRAPFGIFALIFQYNESKTKPIFFSDNDKK